MDISILIYAVIAVAGVAIGWLISSYQHAQQKADQLAEREEIVAELSAAKQQLALSNHWREECELLNNELRNLRDINTSLEADLREVTTRLESTQLHAEDKIRQMNNSEQRLSEQFENLANRIFEHSNRRVDEQNRQSLNSLLTPLREQLDGFRRQVQDSFGQEARERHTLAHEIRNLQQLNAQMAQEEGRFNFDDICAAISDKLERRHPHIFGDATAGNSAEVLARWEQIKSAERAEKSQHSALDDIPLSLPALMRAHKIQKRCSAVGFDWTSLGPVLDKVHEEIDEVMHEAQQAVVDEAKLEEEMGDLLFATVNLSRHLGVKAETALQKANLKFERRFREVERIVASRGLEMSGIDLEAMEEVWQEVKRQESDLDRKSVV